MSTTTLFVLLDYAKEAALLTVGLLIYAQLRPYFARYFKRLGKVLEGLFFSVLVAATMAAPQPPAPPAANGPDNPAGIVF